MAHPPPPPRSAPEALADPNATTASGDPGAAAAEVRPRRRRKPEDRAEASILEEAVIRRRLQHNVRTCRKAAGLTLKMVSERADMHWRHWQKIEAGQVNATLQTLVRVADALDVDPLELVREPLPEKPRA